MTTADLVRLYFDDHRGEWLAVRTIADVLERPANAVRQACKADLSRGLEHNGGQTRASRYRLPAGVDLERPAPPPEAGPPASSPPELERPPAPPEAERPLGGHSDSPAQPPIRLSRKTRAALEAEQRDGPILPAELSDLAEAILAALGRSAGTARDVAGRLVRNVNDVAAELSTLERTHPHRLTRVGRDGGRIVYGPGAPA